MRPLQRCQWSTAPSMVFKFCHAPAHTQPPRRRNLVQRPAMCFWFPCRLEVESQEGALEQLEQSAQEAAHRGREAEQRVKALQDSLQVGCTAPQRCL